MPLLLFLLITVFVTFDASLLHYLEWASQPIQTLCLSALPEESPLNELYQALLCGKKLPASNTKDLFINMGAIHLLVISGAHLIWLESWFSKTTQWLSSSYRWPVILALAFYSLAAGANPPVVRAFIGILFKLIAKKTHLNLTPPLATFTSGILLITFIPEWMFHPSFLLSFLASLILSISPTNPFLQSAIFYLLLSPYFGGFAGLSIASLFTHLIITPIWSTILFPITFLVVLCPTLTPVIDSIWQTFLQVLQWTQEVLRTAPSPNFMAGISAWYYLTFLFFIGHTLSTSKFKSQERVPK